MEGASKWKSAAGLAQERQGRIRIGTSGWVYQHWRGPFYPPKLRVKDQLGFYAGRFNTVEINGSFYRLPSEKAVASWAEQAPVGFVFAWKASRYITHAKRLKEVGGSLDLVFGRMAPLNDKLGPALFQLPPQFKVNFDRLAQFLALLPKERRCAVEFRHPSWYSAEVFQLLADHDVALCVSDHHDAPAPWEATASFAYVRGHGPGGRYIGRYPAGDLRTWADHVAKWRVQGRDAYVYFDNDVDGAAPLDAADFQAALA